MQTDQILLVEDNPDDVTFTQRAFSKNNFDNKIIVASDGVAAMELLLPEEEGKAPLRPTLVLLDINLPRLSGLEVLRRLRSEASTRLLPIIMLTTSNDARDVISSYEFGANSFVRKPVAFDDFLQAVKALGEFWLEINEPAPVPNQ